MQRFSFDITHRKGTENIVPDMLSRIEIDEIVFSSGNSIIDITNKAFSSPPYKALIDTIEQNSERLPDLKVMDNFIYKRTLFRDGEPDTEDHVWKLWVPEELTNDLIEKMHTSETSIHCGIAKTLYKIREYFFWPKMCIQVRNFIQNCDLCKECKPANKTLRPPIGAQVQTSRAFEKLYVDFLGPYPRSKNQNAYIFIVLDHQTKFILLKAMKKATSKAVIKFLIDEIFFKFGVPNIIHSDNGRQFISKDFKDTLDAFGITHIKTAIHAPQSNASERVNQSILAAIRTQLDKDQNDWDQKLANIECSLRSTVHASIGVTPYFALFGQNMVTHASAYEIAKRLNILSDGDINILSKDSKLQLIRNTMKKKLDQAYQKNVQNYNKRCRDVSFKIGQELFRRNFVQSDFKRGINAKLCKPWLKCRVRKLIGKSMYEIENLKGDFIGTYHAKDLKQ